MLSRSSQIYRQGEEVSHGHSLRDKPNGAHLIQIAFVIVEHEHIKCTESTLQPHATVQPLIVGYILTEASGGVVLIFGPFFNREAPMYAIEDGA